MASEWKVWNGLSACYVTPVDNVIGYTCVTDPAEAKGWNTLEEASAWIQSKPALCWRDDLTIALVTDAGEKADEIPVERRGDV